MPGIGPEIRAKCAAAWSDVLERVSAGESVMAAAAAHGLTRMHLWHYRSTDKALRDAWADALRESADAFTDRMLASVADIKDAKAARVLVSTLQWLAEKRDPDRYGQRTRADINVRTVDLTQIIRDANARLAAQQQGRIIDATPSNSGAEGLLARTLPAESVPLEDIL